VVDKVKVTEADQEAFPRFYAAERTVMSPPYLAFQWKDEQGRRCTQVIAPFAANDEPRELARRCNAGLPSARAAGAAEERAKGCGTCKHLGMRTGGATAKGVAMRQACRLHGLSPEEVGYGCGLREARGAASTPKGEGQ
jgi:hypothetical protein